MRAPVGQGGPAGTVSTSAVPRDLVPAALPLENPGYIDPPPVDLTLAANLRQINLNSRHLETLSHLGLTATRVRQGNQACLNFADIYGEARRRGLPLLVTRDALLNAYRRSLVQILQCLEESHMWAKALAFLFPCLTPHWSSGDPPSRCGSKAGSQPPRLGKSGQHGRSRIDG